MVKKKKFRGDFNLVVMFIILACFVFYLIDETDLCPPGTLGVNHDFESMEEILKYEIKLAKEIGYSGKKNCLWYARHYNQSLRKYPELDVRWENRNVDICNNMTLCDSPHTFIIVGGYGGEAILDQTSYAFLKIKGEF